MKFKQPYFGSGQITLRFHVAAILVKMDEDGFISKNLRGFFFPSDILADHIVVNTTEMMSLKW